MQFKLWDKSETYLGTHSLEELCVRFDLQQYKINKLTSFSVGLVYTVKFDSVIHFLERVTK